MKDKLIEIIKDNYEIAAINHYDAWSGDVEYTDTSLNTEELADAIIKGGFISIDKVGELFNNIFDDCPCGYIIDEQNVCDFFGDYCENCDNNYLKCWTKYVKEKLKV